MENWEWAIDIFAFIGMLVCVIIALIAIVWVTCFAVKLLAKTFGVRVGKSYELTVENITKKAEAKKERNELKRKAEAERKMEILNMKLESKQKIHEMKKQKLAENLSQKEQIAKSKIFKDDLGEDEQNQENQEEIKELDSSAPDEENKETKKSRRKKGE